MAMRVLHVQRAKGVSGSERHLLSLLPALGAVGVETRMCVLSTGEGQRFVSQLEGAGVDVAVRNAGGDLNVKLVPELVADIREFRADIVHTHLLHADLVGQVAAQASAGPGHLVGARDTRLLPARAVSQHRPRHRAASRGAASRFRSTLRGSYVRSGSRLPSASESSTTASTPNGGHATRHRGPRRGRRSASKTPTLVIGIAARLIDGKGHATLIEAVGQGGPRGRDSGCATRGRGRRGT